MKKNPYNHAQFIVGAHNISQFPADTGREVAFAGRSNAGKSSVLNTISGNQRLARISKTPGRTQQLNFFAVTETVRLVDLPGYGYAKVPERMKLHWGQVLETYLSTRASLAGLILIMDIRHPSTPQDADMINWCLASDLPVHVLLNKADKLSRGKAMATLQIFKQRYDQPGFSAQLFSALKHTGVDEVRSKLREWLELN